MPSYRTIIDELASYAAGELAQHPDTIQESVVDNDDIYEKCLILAGSSDVAYTPKSITFSHDSDTGYYMDIDDITWEFDNDVASFENTAKEYVQAIQQGNMELVERKLLGLLTIGKELRISNNHKT